MIHHSDTARSMAADAKKARFAMSFLAAAFFIFVLWLSAVSVYADDAALTVRKDGETVREFTQEELRQIASEEGDRTYTYSAWNTFPTFDKKGYANVKGPTVHAVLEKAGLTDDVSDEGTVTFSDGSYTATLTGYQLFTENRYYFPDGALADPMEGAAPEESYADASEVVPVICLTDSKDGNIFCIGQAAPNDENKPAFVKSGYKTDENGKPLLDDEGRTVADLLTIEVSTEPAAKCVLPAALTKNKSLCSRGQEIAFKGSNRNLEYIYYTMDGSEPDYGSAIYNSAMNQGRENRPVLPNAYGIYQIRVKVKAYGKLDSDVGTFTYYVGPSAKKPSLKVSAGKGKATLKWSRISGATGYVIYRSVRKNSGYKAAATIKKGSTVKYVNKKLKKGKKYYYKVRAFRTVNGRKIYGTYSAVKAVKIR